MEVWKEPFLHHSLTPQVPRLSSLPAPAPEAEGEAVSSEAAGATGPQAQASAAEGLAGSPSASNAAPATGTDTAPGGGTLARVEAGVVCVYSALSAALEGPDGDLVAMSFERAEVPTIW